MNIIQMNAAAGKIKNAIFILPGINRKMQYNIFFDLDSSYKLLIPMINRASYSK